MISRFLPEGVRRFLGGAKPKAALPTYVLLDQPGQLEPLLALIDQVDEVCLDTEADNMHRYRTRVCLLQFLVKDEVFLVDALAPMNFAPLWERLATKHLVMHGSDYDLRLLHDLCEFKAKSIFDTMLAAQLLNRKRVGLAALLEDYFQVALSKDSQKANWSKRPLTKKLLDYAAMDVWHLPELRDLLTRELVKLDRLDWLEQQCQRQIESAQVGFPRDDQLGWRIGKSERLRGRGLSVLHAVWHWREQQAERLDTPPFKVCNNELLLRMAFAAEEGDEEAAILAKVNLGRRHARLAPSLTAAVHAGLARDPQSLPRRKRNHDHQPLSMEELALQDRLKADRDVLATKLELEPTLIANRAQLAQISRAPDKVDEILLPWQAQLVRSLPSLANGTTPSKRT
jgi:ribonuclease D